MKAKPDHISQKDWDNADIPELDEDFFNHAVRSTETTSQGMADDVMRQYRGAQKTATKQSTTIRLPSNVIDFFKADGKGWQTRLSHALEEYVAAHKQG